jgi:hypothetical protein
LKLKWLLNIRKFSNVKKIRPAVMKLVHVPTRLPRRLKMNRVEGWWNMCAVRRRGYVTFIFLFQELKAFG